MTEPLVAIEGLSYRYPGSANDSLVDVSLTIEPGELVVLAGRSGSGKTSLLRACCGLVPHYHGGEIGGSLAVAGLDLREHGPAELGGIVGLVAQEPETHVISATVRGELELPLDMRGDPPGSRARAVEEVALALGIPHLLGRPTAELSGGELQRVALAAALVMRPRLVALDEPTSQLDPVAGDELVSLLRRLNEEWGTAILLAEHRLERCLAAADRVVAMSSGRIAFDGRPGDFLEWAIHADAALATPGARLFSLAGLRPLPVGVKRARATLHRRLHDHGGAAWDGEPGAARAPEGATGRRGRSRVSPGDAALRARGLWVELEGSAGRRDVLRGLDLTVEHGERIALMGRNGAGKTTLLRAAAGMLEPVKGAIDAAGGCALLPQNPADLLIHELVRDELPGEGGRRALEAVGLGWANERDSRDLSGGERQRLALAVVMAGRTGGRSPAPGLVCLDEPTRGMDRGRKEELAGWLAELAASGSAVIVATHDVEFAAIHAARVVLLGDGESIADGAADEILSGGWYFATEVARILGDGAAISPERGAAMLRERLRGPAGALR